MSTSRQLAYQAKRMLSVRKQDLISKVYNAILHRLNDSYLLDSSHWPTHGFIPGYGGEFTKTDTITIGIRIDTNSENGNIYRSVNFNIIQKSKKRAYEQAEAIDLILDCSFYDDIYFYCNWPADIALTNRYKYQEWPYKNNCYYSQIQFTFDSI